MTRLIGCALVVAVACGCGAFHAGPVPGAPKDARWAVVDGVHLRIVDSGGDRPVVVLLHGFGSSLDAWKGVRRELEPSYRVIALDLKGFGWSGRPPGDYSPSAQAALVLGLLDQLGAKGFDVVGHSWGASVALAMALAAPDRVKRLALYDAWAYSDQLPTFFIWARPAGLGEALFALFYRERAEDRLAMAFHDPSFVTQGLVDSVEAALERPGTVAAALAAVRGQRYESVEGRYRTIEAPVLLLWGENDVVTPLTVGRRLARELPGARLVSFPACGHLPMIEARAASTAALRTFLDGKAPR